LLVRVRVHPGSRKPKAEEREDGLHVWVRAPAVEGKANAAVLEALADLYDVPKSAIRLSAGQTSKTKVFEIRAK